MKYIDLINGFWLVDEQKEFTPNETRLYFFLLHLANRFFWKTEWFEYGDEKMQAAVGILKFIKSSELLESLKEKSIRAYSKMPMIIDEFGREPKQIMDFRVVS